MRSNCPSIFWEVAFDISLKISPKVEMCTKCQNLFSRNSKKTIISNRHLLIFFPSMLSVNQKFASVVKVHSRTCFSDKNKIKKIPYPIYVEWTLLL